jgi:hypothetical protein
MSDMHLETALSLPSGFIFGEVSSLTAPRAAVSPPPSLGPLAAFTGTFRGSGFNLIFRPDSVPTPTPLPIPVSGSDNVLELNLTLETLSFSPMLGSVPNRGSLAQRDIFLNGVPYLQTISDVTVPSQPVGIHFEPGFWMAVPATTHPAEGSTLVRMASIPHGTTVEAQGTSSTIAGKPTIPAVDITPFLTNPPHTKIPFPSQTAATSNTARIPQNLASFIAAGTITQAMLTDPNTLLRNHIASQTITSTTALAITSNPAAPLFGGGADNIAFLLGNPAASGTAPNAQTVKMTATFWIETVGYAIEVPIFEPGQPPLIIPAVTGPAGQPVPEFVVNPPIPITAPRSITVKATQIQYSQQVFLNFNGLTWPHVSVATLVPAGPISIPPSAWA